MEPARFLQSRLLANSQIFRRRFAAVSRLELPDSKEIASPDRFRFEVGPPFVTTQKEAVP
jgi:hypothetical protein